MTHRASGTAILMILLAGCALAVLPLPATAQEIYYDVPLVAQVNDKACWAASLQMILTYARKQSIDQNEIAKAVGFTLDDMYGWTELQKAFEHWEFCVKPPASFLPKGWRALLKEHGPIWVVQRSGEKITHAVVLTGMSEDEENPSMYVNDPWPPGEGKVSYVDFSEFEKIFEEVEVENPRYVLQLLYYCGGTFRAPQGEPARETPRRSR